MEADLSPFPQPFATFQPGFLSLWRKRGKVVSGSLRGRRRGRLVSLSHSWPLWPLSQVLESHLPTAGAEPHLYLPVPPSVSHGLPRGTHLSSSAWQGKQRTGKGAETTEQSMQLRGYFAGSCSPPHPPPRPGGTACRTAGGTSQAGMASCAKVALPTASIHGSERGKSEQIFYPGKDLWVDAVYLLGISGGNEGMPHGGLFSSPPFGEAGEAPGHPTSFHGRGGPGAELPQSLGTPSAHCTTPARFSERKGFQDFLM